jgi:hypothetical protein
MSQGDRISQGGKGTNYPFQSKVLKGIQQSIDSLKRYSRIPGFIRSTGTGSIQSDTYSFSVANVGGADGTLLGETIKDGEVVSFDAGSLNNFYPTASITWDATGTEFIVTYNI